MDERGIIIADRDGEYRKELADFFEDAGYSVETTDSAAHVLCSILEKKTPVLLLGNDFDKKVSSVELIHLLKKCNRNLHVIMVSENMPLALARQVRQEGIFYHALRPTSPSDTEEIGLAVECAFEKARGTEARGESERTDATAGARAASRSTDVCSCGDQRGAERNPVRAAWWLIGLITIVAGISVLSLVAAETASEGSSMAIWLFLSFCALIIATQLVPIFKTKLPSRFSFWQTAKQHEDSHEK
jgi:FixJ family two-component response regulator